MPGSVDQFTPGQRLVVVQQIAKRDGPWTTRIIGEVVRYERRPTGSWYAHARGDRLWLDRLVIRKDDGEQVVCNLDGYSRVELLDHPGLSPRNPDLSGAPATHPGAGAETTA